VDIKIAWELLHQTFKEQKELERKRKAFQTFKANNLNYPMIQDMFEAAAKQNPGFFAKLTFPDLTVFEFGVKPRPERREGETF
jgi:hypothetical protein